MQSPKHIFKPFKNRNNSFGVERRRNAVKKTLEHQPHFPKTLTYEDYDQTVYDWLDKELNIVCEGTRVPTYKLFSIQRISEYGQNWKEIDEKGNLVVNFKTITRENNPKHGENQGNNYNIPGDRKYPIFQTKVMDENGDEVIQIYTMKQPFTVDLVYTISIVTDKYLLLNEMNMKVLDAFKGIEKYIFPNGFAVPMLLESTSDESSYTIDDRKYYSQSYQIKVLGFIIKEDDYEVRKLPTRVRSTFSVGENSKNKKKVEKFNINALESDGTKIITMQKDTECKPDNILSTIETEVDYNAIKNEVDTNCNIEVEELEGLQKCFQDSDFEMNVYKKIIVSIPINFCNASIEFKIGSLVELETLQLNNVTDFKLYINNIEMVIGDSDIIFEADDTVKVEAVLKNPMKKAEVKLICFDPNTVVTEDENDENIYLN